MGGFLQSLVTLLPVILQLLDKSSEEQAETLPWAQALTKAAVKAGNAELILAGGIAVRACKMSQGDLQVLVANVQQLQGAVAAMQAQEG